MAAVAGGGGASGNACTNPHVHAPVAEVCISIGARAAAAAAVGGCVDGGGDDSDTHAHPHICAPEAEVCVGMGVRAGRAGRELLLPLLLVVVVAMHTCALVHPL